MYCAVVLPALSHTCCLAGTAAPPAAAITAATAALLRLLLPLWLLLAEALMYVLHGPPRYIFPTSALAIPESIEIDRHSDTRSNTFRSAPDRTTTRKPSLPAC